jgi:3-carboxy-cis,cis-muconate cycloisomerase
MPFSPSDSRLFGSSFASSEEENLFSDETYVGLLLQIEAALAKVQGGLGVIPAEHAGKIAQAAEGLSPDFRALRKGIELDGFPIVELVNQLRIAVGGEAASYVHWGATTQDIMDTALILQVIAGGDLLHKRLIELIQNLSILTYKHRHTLMCGRTHSQQALPITFGFQVATWLAPLLRHIERWRGLKPRLAVVQFGGAVGTLASLGEQGIKVQEELAKELGLGVPPIPWHTQRDNLAELASWLSMVSSSLGKMAQDIILLAQSEVGEVRESDDPARGGSSTMPQKSNPIQSELIVAAARHNAQLLASMHQAMIAEHQRATHGWQLEWLSLPQMFALSASALDKAIFLSKNLLVDTERMQENIRRSQGFMMAEALSFALSQHMSRADAKALVKQAVQYARSENLNLLEAAQRLTDNPIDWESLSEEHYLGSTQHFINQVLNETKKVSDQ